MTGCERILQRLERGPATAAELYAETHCVVHSRIADLRKQGHNIECFRIAGKEGAASFGYRLIPPVFECDVDESAGLAELFATDAYASRKVPAHG